MRLLHQTRASASVEFALVATFFLLPLMVGAVDFVMILAARAQLNTALQALYSFAVTAPANAASATTAGYLLSIINAANGASGIVVSMPASSTIPLKLGTLTVPAGTALPASYYACYPASPSTISTITYQTTACPTGQTQQLYVLYQLTGTVTLPVKLPGLASPYTVNAGGGVPIQ